MRNLLESTDVPLRLIYVDIASPAFLARELEAEAKKNRCIEVLRFDRFVSRQVARIKALRRVTTKFVVFVDNNMLFQRGWLESLIKAHKETGAEVVSPLIVTQGGDLHFSAGLVVRKKIGSKGGKSMVHRPHQQPGIGRAQNLRDVSPKRVDIDFAESHCCLALTQSMKEGGILNPKMRNAQTIASASYILKFRKKKQLVLDPSAVVSIVPIGFGYDLPWIANSYMKLGWLVGSYLRFEALIGEGPGTDGNLSLSWHSGHLRYLLLSMLEDNRLARQDFIAPGEIPQYIRGYDHPLPENADEVIAQQILPTLRAAYPDACRRLAPWLNNTPPKLRAWHQLSRPVYKLANRPRTNPIAPVFPRLSSNES